MMASLSICFFNILSINPHPSTIVFVFIYAHQLDLDVQHTVGDVAQPPPSIFNSQWGLVPSIPFDGRFSSRVRDAYGCFLHLECKGAPYFLYVFWNPLKWARERKMVAHACRDHLWIKEIFFIFTMGANDSSMYNGPLYILLQLLEPIKMVMRERLTPVWSGDHMQVTLFIQATRLRTNYIFILQWALQECCLIGV